MVPASLVEVEATLEEDGNKEEWSEYYKQDSSVYLIMCLSLPASYEFFADFCTETTEGKFIHGGVLRHLNASHTPLVHSLIHFLLSDSPGPNVRCRRVWECEGGETLIESCGNSCKVS